MDIATALGMVGLGLGALSIVLGFLGVQQGRHADRTLASEGEKTRVLLASEADKTRSLVSELHESTKAFIAALSTEHAEILRRL